MKLPYSCLPMPQKMTSKVFGFAAVVTAIAASLYVPVLVSAQVTVRSAVLTSQYAGSEINVRSAPSTQAQRLHIGYAGDAVEVFNQTSSSDGYTWYQIRFRASGAQGWVRQDLLRLLAVPHPTPAVSSVSRSSPAPITAQSATFSAEQISYFLEVAMGAEWGNSEATVKKWEGEVRIQVNGSPTDEDLATLSAVIQDLSALIGNTTQLQLVDSNANVQLYFVPESRFSQYEPNYVPRNLGFFWTEWNNSTIVSARILISTTGVTQSERSHLIREELTQSLGLMQDSYRYEDSIFYQGWTEVNEFSTIDRAVISMLYHPDVRPGMNRAQVTDVLRRANSIAQPAQAQPISAESGFDQILDFSLNSF